MKTKTRKYKTKHRKTRRGGAPIQPVKAPPVQAASSPEIGQVKDVEKPKTSFWGSIFGAASKPGDKIIKATDDLIKLIKEKNISTDLKLEQIKSEATKLT